AALQTGEIDGRKLGPPIRSTPPQHGRADPLRRQGGAGATAMAACRQRMTAGIGESLGTLERGATIPGASKAGRGRGGAGMNPDLFVASGAGAKARVSTLCAMLDDAVATAPETVALRHLGAALTYREVGRAAAALARRLAAIVRPGEVVALVLPNSIEF